MSSLAASPSLPDEIWLAIFELAVFVPNAFDTHAPDLFTYPGPWTHIQEDIRDSLITKRRLVLVCKAWNVLATPSLYQAIFIARKGSLQSLLRTLKAEDATGTAKGRWAVRLDIACPADNCLSSENAKELLRLLPCLRIVVLRQKEWRVGTPDPAEALQDAVAMRTTRSLAVLDVSCLRMPDGDPMHQESDTPCLSHSHILHVWIVDS